MPGPPEAALVVGLVPAIPNKVRPPQPLAWPGLVVRGGGWWGAESLISPADNFTETGQSLELLS